LGKTGGVTLRKTRFGRNVPFSLTGIGRAEMDALYV